MWLRWSECRAAKKCISYLWADCGTVEIQLWVGEDIVWVDGQCFAVQVVSLLRFAGLECGVSLLFLLHQLLCPLQHVHHHNCTFSVNPLTATPQLPHGYSDEASCSRPGKLSFVIFNIRTLSRSLLSIRVPGCQKLQNYKCRFNQVWHRMLYSCTYMG